MAALAAVSLCGRTLEAQGTAGGPAAAAQASPADGWEAAAGGKMAFDVASVKQDKLDARPQSNVKLNNLRQAYAPTGGDFTATNWPLVTYITFAYKLSDQQAEIMAKGLPEWVFTDRFDIEAKSDNHSPTKDQMRLMLQALLEDRFKLVGHWETRQLPVFGLVVAKAGKTGPQLKQHSEDSPCPATDAVSTGSARTAPVETMLKTWPPNCGHIRVIGTDSGVRLAGRNVSMQMIADTLTEAGGPDGRVVVDRTGLTGTFDMVMDFAEEPRPSADGDGGKLRAEDPAPTIQDAITDQLGLKFVKQTAALDCFLVGHVERSSAN
jgi:uncharacterized protein (TIGR03435 family)